MVHLRKFPIPRDGVAWMLSGLCQMHRVPFDGDLVLRQYAPPWNAETLVRAAGELGFRVGARRVAAERLERLPMPCIALMHPSDDGSGASVYGAVLVMAAEADRVLCYEAGGTAPVSLTRAAFGARFAGVVLLAAPRVAPPADPDAGPGRFGFRWFVPELLRHRRIWRDVLAVSLAVQIIGLATPLFTQVIIDKVIAHQSTGTLAVIAGALGIFLVFNAVLSWVRQYLVLHTGNRVDAVLGAEVFEHLFRLPARYFEQRPTGTLVTRLQGVETIREFLSGATVTLLLDLPFLALFLAVMFWYSWQLSLVVVAILAAIAATSALVTPLLRERLNRQFLLGARNQAFLTEYVSGMETVKALEMEPQLGARYGDFLASYLRAGFRTRQLANTYGVAAGALEQAMTLAILVAGAWMAMTRSDFTIGMLVAFQMFASRLSGPVLRLVGLWQELQQAGIAVRRLGDIMDAPAEPRSLKPSREAAGRGEIVVEGLAFRYADNLPWLYRDLNLAIAPGRCVALMGPSGSGKSTLAKLLLGFFQPQEGRVLLDGHDIRHLAANELRRNFGVVPQETVLFSGSLHDNLLLANPHASFEEVVEACRLAEIHDVIERLPQGYQTAVGEHGAGLSGGQKQRVAIARALLRRAPVLIFDEATSGLDPATAEQFARTVNRLRGRVTILFIAHQIPRGLQVDEAVTLGDGLGPRGVVVEEARATYSPARRT